MGYFLLLFIPNTVSTLFQYFPSVEMDLGTRSMCIIISTFYIPGHSVLIVLVHPKLKSKAKKIICFNKQSIHAVAKAMHMATLGLLMVVAVAEFLIGLVGNGVLVVWSFVEWVRKLKKSSYNLIVLGLAGCRLLLQCLIMVDLMLFPIFKSCTWFRYLSVFWVVVSQASLWFATFLSVFYCKKITTFEHPVYLWLKQRAYSLIAWCLLGCFLINLLIIADVGLKSQSHFQGNSSILYSLSDWQYLHILQLNAGSGLPFSVFLISSGMLIVSLYRHHKKMKVHTAGQNDARAKAHITVLKSLVCFLILYLVYVVASPYSITSKSSPVNLTTIFISETLMAAYPSLHSVILIMGNPRIKQACQRFLWKAVRAWES
ncbi:hypothetical protein QTO34_004653 [Cnephaeus nilssonii]|uniref:Taste receptor type 2 member 5 n=1 Tax=Cnephaeus nilssonii TaxID=3371016 RepID=A0AA40HPR6_CNENI|nr:hypothetical protein QTO34_004653 [Eptesicus nilssonii]